MNSSIKIAHYTTGVHALQIFTAGYLDVTPGPQALARGEKPICWFSSNLDQFPATAMKPLHLPGGEIIQRMGLEDMANHCGGAFRFVTTADAVGAIEWMLLKHRANIPRKLVKRLVRKARAGKEKPSTWWGTLDCIPWCMTEVQIHRDGQWVTFNPGTHEIHIPHNFEVRKIG